MANRQNGDVGLEMDPVDKHTRFQVNLVDSNTKTDELEHLCQEEDGGGERGRLYSESYDTKHVKSFRHLTREALPRLENYRNIMSIHAAPRPTLDELHHATLHTKDLGQQQTSSPIPGKAGGDEGVVKFGWVKGVLVRCLLNIWGVMLFLRLSWVVGQAGVGLAMVVVLGASVVTIITSLSMSAISTNGVIKGGGTYYMISRSLGPEFGGSIGLIFSLANAIACAMYVVGFCESFVQLLNDHSLSIVDGAASDIRIVGSITILVLTGIVCVGMEWEAKTQVGLLGILVVAMLDFFFGTFIGPKSDNERARGFVGYDNELFATNFWPSFQKDDDGVMHDFFSVFSIFFPAATGILAGANISGDLQDPQGAIPKGTLLAVLITSLSYLLLAVQAGWVMEREATGDVADWLAGNLTSCHNQTCQYGLLHSFQVMELVSGFGPLIYAGCFAATLSSALASLVSAPKVFQALCKDNLYPYISAFARGYGKNNEPVRGYILTFFIALCFILIGNLNAIAPLISNFFLAAYALINFSTFHATLVKPVGWRPTFKFYNMWLSLTGAILCVVVMILISWWTALVTLAVVFALYLIVAVRKPDVNWGSTTQAQTYKNALTSILQLNQVDEHVKNFRPQILVLSGPPSQRPSLVDFGYLLTKNLSLLVCANVIQESVPQRVKNLVMAKSTAFLRAHKIKAFYSHVDGLTFECGARALLQAVGVGKLKPNILLMGYKSDWRGDRAHLLMYFNVIHQALDMHMAVGILRVEGGLDYGKLLGEEHLGNGHAAITANGEGIGGLKLVPSATEFPRNDSFIQNSAASSSSDLTASSTPHLRKAADRVSVDPDPEHMDPPEPDSTVVDEIKTKNEKSKRESRSDLFRGPGGVELPKDVVNKVTQFQRRQRKGTIDVWWLYDDGGLTLLLPYIISTRSHWGSSKLRVFTLANKKDELEFEQRSMASLLAKFRIDYSDLTVIPDITKKAGEKSLAFFEDLIRDQKQKESDDEEDEVGVSAAELLANQDKTNRHLRLRELLMEKSADANLVVMTLPMPRKSMVSASLYMAWLEVLTTGMPPFLLVRGNQTSVLTFYS